MQADGVALHREAQSLIVVRAGEEIWQIIPGNKIFIHSLFTKAHGISIPVANRTDNISFLEGQ